MAELKVIGGAAFRTFRNLWMLEELGVAYTHIAAMPRSPDAKAANPFGKIPALIDQTADGQSFTIYGAFSSWNQYTPVWEWVWVRETGQLAYTRLLLLFTESAAINTYLGDKFRGREGYPDLVPEAGTIQRGRYEQQVMVVMAELDAQGLWIHRKHEALGHIFGEIPQAVAHAKQHVQKVVDVLEADLRSNGPYLCGSSFSAAVRYTRTI